MEEKFTAKTLKCGFIGAGNMAWAIFQKLRKSGCSAQNFIASAPSRRNLGKWEDAGTATTHDNGKKKT
ncbi:hypothetical protein B566_EDAN005371 [Ephemera danica]|nr:hypothetical protein B566_EDAN005371 [Ephemera danica]